MNPGSRFESFRGRQLERIQASTAVLPAAASQPARPALFAVSLDYGHGLEVSSTVKRAAAFARADLLATLATFLVLALIFTACVRESGTIAGIKRCAGNLRELGLATAFYEKDNHNTLPFAFIKFSDGRSDSVTWDMLILPYLDTNTSTDISSTAFDRRQLFLQCPDDNVERRDLLGYVRVRRTYSMSGHDMASINWPPGPGNRTGIGLWWSDSVSNGPAAVASVTSPESMLPAFRLGDLSKPADTLLLTEQVRPDNIMFSYLGATIGPADSQFKSSNAAIKFHGGKFNYLMVDGHVETSAPGTRPSMWMASHQ